MEPVAELTQLVAVGLMMRLHEVRSGGRAWVGQLFS